MPDPDLTDELLAAQAARQALLDLRLHLLSNRPRPQSHIDALTDQIRDLDAEIDSLKTLPVIPALSAGDITKLQALLRDLRQRINRSAAVEELLVAATDVLNEVS